MSINDLNVNPRILTAIKKAQLTSFEKILSSSILELLRATGLAHGDLQVLRDAVSEAVPKPSVVTALDIWKGSCSEEHKIKKLSSGCRLFDEHLRGGFITRGLTEICGESASGKTQICLQLCLTCQLPVKHGGLEGGAAYICTEDVFPNKRLYQLIEHFSKTWKHQLQEESKLGDRIFVEHVADLDGLLTCIHKKLPLLLNQGMVQLIVIDSIAALFRCEFESGEMVKRAKLLGSLAAKLRRLGQQHNIPVICVNQVSANMSGEVHRGKIKTCIPALGLAWANQVTSRFMLSREHPHTAGAGESLAGTPSSDHEHAIVRLCEVVFAPYLPPVIFPFVVEQGGLRALQ